MNLRTCVFVVAPLVLSGTAPAQQQIRSLFGPAGSQYGKAVVVIPDQNGDGFEDLLVGAPGWNNERGAVYCLSGQYLKAGLGSQYIWTLAPPVQPGDRFGSAMTLVGDVDGDGRKDFLIGQPGYDRTSPPVALDIGAVRLVYSGSLGIATIVEGSGIGSRFGSSMAACGDLNLNGVDDVAVGEPGWNNAVGSVSLFDGSILDQSGTVQTLDYAQVTGTTAGGELGAAIAGGFDLTADGYPELVVGSPGFDGSGATDSGRIVVRDFVNAVAWTHTSSVAGERMGESVSIAADYDGDGVPDVVAGAPGWSGGFVEDGRVHVLSGAKLVDPSSPTPLQVYTLTLGFSSTIFDLGLGASVLACGDLNGDGVGDILAGAPDYSVLSGFQVFNRGAVALYSGATGARMGLLVGSNTDRLGDALGVGIGDLEGDGFDDFLVGGSLSDVGGVDSGVLKACRIFPATPTSYCTGKTNSLGCVPAMTFSGAPSASDPTPFTVGCSNVLNQVSGLLFYSHSPASSPFQGGTRCVSAPVRRTAVQNSGGNATGSDCSGLFGIDFNARIQTGVDPSLVAGAEVFGQYWSRDPASPSTTSLSNGLRFLISP